MLRNKSVWVSWKEGRQRWEVGFWWEGKQYRYFSWMFQEQKWSFTRPRKELAEEFAHHIRALMRPKHGVYTFDPDQLRTGRKKSLYSFSNYAENWIKKYDQKIATKDISKEYVDHLRRYNRLYWQPHLADWDVREISEVVVDDFYLWLCNEHSIGKKHIQNIMDGLKKLIHDAAESISDLKMPVFPKYKIKKKQGGAGEYLKEVDQDHVLSFVPEIHKPIVTTAFYHGIRLSEIRDLRRKHLIDVDGFLSLDVKTRKGGPDRIITLDPLVAELIKAIPPTLQHDYLFHHAGIPYTKTTLWKIIRRALDKAGFSDITPNQASRHGHCSQLWTRGMPPNLIQYLMGHSDIRTTMIYSHIDPEEQERYARSSTHTVHTVSKDESTT